MGQSQIGGNLCNQVIIMDQLLDSAPLTLTGNTDTVYASAFLNLLKDGPTACSW